MSGQAQAPAQAGFPGRSSHCKVTSGWWAGLQLSGSEHRLSTCTPQLPQG